MSLGSAIGPDVANAPRRKHSLSLLLFPPTLSIAFARIVSMFGEDFLDVSGFQTVQLSVFTFYELVIAGIVIVTSSFKFPIIIGAGPRVRLPMTVTMCALVCA